MSNYKHKLLQEKIRLLAEELQVAHEDTANALPENPVLVRK